jgi:hypothetical protein
MAVSSLRAFDPLRIGTLESDAWVHYYRREWLGFLRAAISLTRRTFGLDWPSTLYGAWLVLRANQLWAPYPVNDPASCRRLMARFYRMVARRHGERFDPVEAARLEVQWWRVHRVRQHGGSPEDERALIEALTSLYTCVCRVGADAVRPAAEQRALAMRQSDEWVAQGCDLSSPLVDQECAALVRSYASLLAAVHIV